ncbi:MAG: shikimate kinase [Clostridia bacterium]|nr:shikimate kinase [Clostridia bacterium]MBQ8369993.1 shikimate kinase [Clostridia bacterium]MBQ8511558.1 shikimate kinase [Clostridia bacterium]
MKNIILVGMPGSGKSTLGILLAKKIHYGYIDSDSIIVAMSGKLLPELIEELGNEGFLDLEARVNGSIKVQRCVIATGGSAIYRGGVIEKMKENGIVVYLKIPYEEVERRLGDLKKRGVVLRDGYTLRDLYAERAPLYEMHADYIVELSEDSVEDSAEKVRQAILAELEED